MKKYIIYILFVAAAFTACKKSDLDRFPQTSISPTLFFNNENDLSSYVNGLLTMPDRWTYLGEQGTDNTSTTASIEANNVMLGNATAENITSGWDWGTLRNINYFLQNYNHAQLTADIKNHYAGLAKYYRALFYLGKVQRFSDVPWYSTTLSPGDPALFKPRDPRALVMDSVMADLSFAYQHVRTSVPSGTPGKWAVAAFYIRAALYEGTYRKYHPELNLGSTANAFLDTAISVANQVMASGNFSIYNTGNPNQDYATLFDSQDLTTNPEVMLDNVFDLSKGRGENVNGYVFGDYEQAPAKDLIQSYLMKDGTRFTDQPGYATMGFVQEFQNRDPRLAQTMVYPGWIMAPDTTPYIQVLNKDFTGYHQLKGYVNSTDQNIQNGVDYPVYRYAEVLLSYAEARAELGTLTQQDLDMTVNLIRRRAGMPDLNMAQANANPDLILQQKYGNIQSNVGVIIEIRRERRVEFAFEGTRFEDLMRWGAGQLLAKNPEGMFFAGLGQYDLTGDGIPDIILIDPSTSIPNPKQTNSLGVPLIYYTASTFGSSATVYLQNTTTGSNIVTGNAQYIFQAPKDYYRPIPETEVLLNPNLKQIFGW